MVGTLDMGHIVHARALGMISCLCLHGGVEVSITEKDMDPDINSSESRVASCRRLFASTALDDRRGGCILMIFSLNFFFDFMCLFSMEASICTPLLRDMVAMKRRRKR
jgi:hypothetical protein